MIDLFADNPYADYDKMVSCFQCGETVDVKIIEHAYSSSKVWGDYQDYECHWICDCGYENKTRDQEGYCYK